MDIPLLLIFVGSMFLAGRLAECRGRSFKAWAWIAAVIGPLALPALWLLPNRHGADGDSSPGPQGREPGMRKAAALQSRHPGASDHPGTPISRQLSALSFSAAFGAK